MKQNIEVCISPLLFPLFKSEPTIVVVIDILRATSVICTAAHYGAAIVPVATVEEALNLQSKGMIAAAERNGETQEGFELGNSPFSYMDDRLRGKTIALTTTNGTQAIEVAKTSSCVVIGSFLNLSFLKSWLVHRQQDVILLCAGWKNKFNLEDSLFAGALTRQLLLSGKYETNCDSAIASMQLYDIAKDDLYGYLENSSHRKRLSKLNLEKDVRYCLTPDQCDVIPVLEGGVIKKISP